MLRFVKESRRNPTSTRTLRQSARPVCMRPFPECPRNNRAFKKAATPASAGDIEAHCQVVALDAAFVCAVGAGKSTKGAECGPGGRPSGRPVALDEAPAGCEEAQARRERGLFEPAKRASSGPSARKTSRWLVFSEVGKASAFPRTIPVLPRRSDERLARD